MRPRTIVQRVGLGVGLALGLLFLTPGSAGATLEGPCQASGVFLESGLAIDAAAVGNETITVPRSDSVQWQGSVSVAAADRQISGFVAVDLPPPFGRVTIDSWGGPANRVSNEGVENYDLGTWVPGGVTFRVFGEHRDEGATCSGEVFVQVEGGFLDSPLGPISLGLTGLAGAGFIGVIWPLFRPGM